MRKDGDIRKPQPRVREVGHDERRLARDEAHLRHLHVLDLEHSVGEPDTIEHLERGRVHRVAAEVAIEVFLGFEKHDAHASTGEEQTEHDAGRAPADDGAIDLGYRGHSQPNAPAVKRA